MEVSPHNGSVPLMEVSPYGGVPLWRFPLNRGVFLMEVSPYGGVPLIEVSS